MLNATRFAGGDKQTEVLVIETNFSAFAMYNKGKPDSIVAVNLDMWNSATGATNRPIPPVAIWGFE